MSCLQQQPRATFKQRAATEKKSQLHTSLAQYIIRRCGSGNQCQGHNLRASTGWIKERTRSTTGLCAVESAVTSRCAKVPCSRVHGMTPRHCASPSKSISCCECCATAADGKRYRSCRPHICTATSRASSPAPPVITCHSAHITMRPFQFEHLIIEYTFISQT